MLQVKSIKIHLIVFGVLLVAFLTVASILFQGNYSQFRQEIFQRSKNNVEVIDTLERLETYLYNYQNAFYLYLSSGDFKWKSYMKENKGHIEEGFDKLENDNKEYFRIWVPVANFTSAEPKNELVQTITAFKEGENSDSDFQRLFYLIRFNTKKYFDRVQERLQQADVTTQLNPQPVNVQAEEAYVDILYAGISHIRNSYNLIFWDMSRYQNDRFNKNARLYFYGMVGTSGFLLLYGFFIAFGIFSFFGKQRLREENLVMLGARDLVTGLFNRRSFEVLIGQEIERAKRRKTGLLLFAFKLEPYEKIRDDIGHAALDRLLFQVSSTLRSSCRGYDGVYRYDKDVFIVVFSETNAKMIDPIILRFKNKLYKKAFIVSGNQTKIVPVIKFGVAAYPVEGDDYKALLELAFSRMTADFKAFSGLLSAQPLAAETISSTMADTVFAEPVFEETALPAAEPVQASGPRGGFEAMAFESEPPSEPVAEPSSSTLPDQPSQAPEDGGQNDLLPEIIQALTQEEGTLKSPVLEQPVLQPEINSPAIAAAPETGTTASPADSVASLPEVEVIRSDQEDIIMVDFDREKLDLAERFRIKQKMRRSEKN